MSEPARPRVCVVLVAYNRRDLLLQALDALGAQTRPADEIVVVNNSSTDDSAEVARRHATAPVVVDLDRNTGGAGGFAAGMAAALDLPGERSPDWLWLMDDDTIPQPGALSALLDAAAGYPGSVDVLGSRVVWKDGRDHPMNTPRQRPRASAAERRRAASVGSVPVRSSSFVSMLVSASSVRAHGLPIADYFIWNDDFEFSCRVLRDGTGLHVPSSVVEHRTVTFGATDADPGERFYFEVRNKVWMLTRSGSLSASERILYSGATLRRWVRAARRSRQRPVLARALGRGLRDGVRRGPRPTTEVLADLGSVSSAVARLEGAA